MAHEHQGRSDESRATRSDWKWCCVIAGAGLVGAVALALLPVSFSIGKFVYEDFFYYLKVAENVVAGKGATLDGVARTNGFHPLWMLIVVSLCMWLPPTWLPQGVLLVAALIHALQTLLLFHILRRDVRFEIAVGASAFWAMNYRVLACNLCGLETPLQILGVLVVIWLLQGIARGDRIPGRWLGVALGMAILSRFDLLLLIPLVVWGVMTCSGVPVAERARSILKTLLVAFACLVPWFLWSFRQSGVLLPNSRVALGAWLYPRISLSYPLNEMVRILRHKIVDAVAWLADSANLFGLWPVLYDADGPNLFKALPGVLLILFAILATGAAVIGVSKTQKLLRLGLAAYALLHLSYYVLNVRAEVRYVLPFNMVLLLLASWGCERLVVRRVTPRLLLGIASLAFSVACYAGTQAWKAGHGATRFHYLHYQLYDTAKWIREHLPSDAVIGSCNAGILSYYSARTVVNLDGVINDEVIPYLVQGRIEDYLRRRSVNYLVDVEGALDDFLMRVTGSDHWKTNWPVLTRIRSVVVRYGSP